MLTDRFTFHYFNIKYKIINYNFNILTTSHDYSEHKIKLYYEHFNEPIVIPSLIYAAKIH